MACACLAVRQLHLSGMDGGMDERRGYFLRRRKGPWPNMESRRTQDATARRPAFTEERLETSQASLSGAPLLRVVGDIHHDVSSVFNEAVLGVLAQDGGGLLLDFSTCPHLSTAVGCA
jgi:hypothetical protein